MRLTPAAHSQQTDLICPSSLHSMIMINISEGDVVRLKSGGPVMTVNSVNDGYARCSWFNGDKLERESFALETLERAPNSTLLTAS
jgi:uncharacterized protein YodC (DUF2158 family)